MKKIFVTLDELDEAIKALDEHKKQCRKIIKDLIEAMCDYGEDFAINLVGHIDTGKTVDSIRKDASHIAYRNGNYGLIVAGGNAIWLEFGTGVTKNQGNAHPPVADPGNTTIYPHGTYGKGKGANPGWYYIDETKGEKGEVCYTQGIEGNQFMYRTALAIRDYAPELFKEMFG